MESLNSNFQGVLSIKGGFKRACVALFDQDTPIFRELLLLNLDHLEKQLDKEEFQTESIDAFRRGKVDSSKALDTGLVVTKSNETELERHVSSSRSEKDTHAEDADINSVNDKQPLAEFAKPSILGKPVLQPPRNQSVVRQPNAFKSERPNFSKPRFASQVDVNNVSSKPVTQHYLPKGRESAFAKPNHVIASSSSRNSSKNMPRFSSNDMAHNYYLEEAKKKTQD
ncbi:hypothetical protein Tco_0819924 [Tanacetum coccineum]|uniref:Uncharacterized protein n=1 Tax=Tanacetum coccineum TaxID=301880 RepID=A0ABQ5A7Y2_9ASTR